MLEGFFGGGVAASKDEKPDMLAGEWGEDLLSQVNAILGGDQTAEQGVEKILAADDGLLKEAIYAATGQKDIKGGMLFSLFRRGGNAKAAGIKQDIGLESEHAFTARMRTLKEGGWVVQGRSNSFTLEPKTRNQIIREAEKLIRKHLDDPGSMPDARKELPRHYLQAVSSYTAAASESKTTSSLKGNKRGRTANTLHPRHRALLEKFYSHPSGYAEEDLTEAENGICRILGPHGRHMIEVDGKTGRWVLSRHTREKMSSEFEKRLLSLEGEIYTYTGGDRLQELLSERSRIRGLYGKETGYVPVFLPEGGAVRLPNDAYLEAAKNPGFCEEDLYTLARSVKAASRTGDKVADTLTEEKEKVSDSVEEIKALTKRLAEKDTGLADEFRSYIQLHRDYFFSENTSTFSEGLLWLAESRTRRRLSTSDILGNTPQIISLTGRIHACSTREGLGIEGLDIELLQSEYSLGVSRDAGTISVYYSPKDFIVEEDTEVVAEEEAIHLALYEYKWDIALADKTLSNHLKQYGKKTTTAS